MRRRRERRDRDDLAGEYRWGDTGQLIFLFVFLAVWIVDSFIFKYSVFLTNYVPIYIRIPIAVVFLFLSGYLAKTGLDIIFGETRDTPNVVSNGIFGIVRHPIYLGSVLFYFALLSITLSLIAAIVLLIIIGFYHYLALYEEKLLSKKFGAKYEQYMKTVPMWIPRTRIFANRKRTGANRD